MERVLHVVITFFAHAYAAKDFAAKYAIFHLSKMQISSEILSKKSWILPYFAITYMITFLQLFHKHIYVFMN